MDLVSLSKRIKISLPDSFIVEVETGISPLSEYDIIIMPKYRKWISPRILPVTTYSGAGSVPGLMFLDPYTFQFFRSVLFFGYDEIITRSSHQALSLTKSQAAVKSSADRFRLVLKLPYIANVFFICPGKDTVEFQHARMTSSRS